VTVVDDEVLTAAVRAAYLPALLVALAHALDDLSLLRDELRPDPAKVQDPGAGLSPERRAEARELAIEHLRVLAERPARSTVPATDDTVLRALFSFLTGRDVSDDYVELLHEELGLTGDDPRTPRWRKDDIDAGRAFSAVVIGAGMSGLACAHRLRQAGVPFVVIEKNDDVGGTWFENRYPGCRVDVPNHLYSYSFHQRRDWPQRFTPQAELLEYFRDTAATFELREHIRFGTEVVRAQFREEHGDWEVHVRSAAGDEVLHADVVVSAVGQLNRPRLPDIPGRERFAGPAFHSARWDPDLDLRGKRVAVVGTAASGFQLIPPIAEEAAELFVFQRTANWFAPTRDYHGDTPPGMQWLLDNLPTYSEWYRLSLFWRQYDGMLAAATPGPRNDEFRAFLTDYLEEQFDDRPDLRAKVVPSYPPLAKRILLDDGIWASTLRRPNVELVTDAIDEITEDGIVAGGRLRSVDVIVFATGFHASEFLMPMQVIGRDGVDLHDRWGGDARAYLGLTIPGFPNLFCMYGPNTNLVANGSIIYLSECEVQYILSAIRLMLERGIDAIDVRPEVHDAYNVAVDRANAGMVWGAATVNTWYRNANGRIAQNWPFTLLEYWQRTRAPKPDDYEFVD